MTRSPQGPVPPRVPGDLVRETLSGMEDDREWCRSEATGDLSSQVASRVDVSECRFVGARLTAAELYRARVSDTVFVDCDLSAALFHEAEFTRVEFRDCRMRGFSASQARLDDVRFVECRLDGAEFRMATGRRVQFDHCWLAGADFYAARLAELRLFDSNLVDIELSKSDLAGARLHGSTLERLKGAGCLRDVTIDSAQLLPMALQVFAAIGVHVDDDRDASSIHRPAPDRITE